LNSVHDYGHYLAGVENKHGSDTIIIPYSYN